jgi:dTDP-4-amino-4,6-dideoxygalactose transaminase
VKVPLLDVTRIPADLQARLEARAIEVLRSGEYILGPAVSAFERDCERVLEVPHALGVSNGSDAILMLLMALGIGPGDEVIVPSYTFFATAGAVSRLGGTPVFADSCADTLNLDPAQVSRLITARTRAIIPVHLFGLAADLAGLRSVAGDLPILEDAAQSFLARYGGRPVGASRRPVRTRSSPARTWVAMATVAWSPHATQPWQSACASCALTAASRSTTTPWWAGTFAWTRSRPRCCT